MCSFSWSTAPKKGCLHTHEKPNSYSRSLCLASPFESTTLGQSSTGVEFFCANIDTTTARGWDRSRRHGLRLRKPPPPPGHEKTSNSLPSVVPFLYLGQQPLKTLPAHTRESIELIAVRCAVPIYRCAFSPGLNNPFNSSLPLHSRLQKNSVSTVVLFVLVNNPRKGASTGEIIELFAVPYLGQQPSDNAAAAGGGLGHA